MEIDKVGIEKFLPHRDPFLFLDKVISIEVPGKDSLENGEASLSDLQGTKVKATFNASEKLDFFRGHFPGNPVVPGVIQVEMMAQAACFSLRKMIPDDSDHKLQVALAKVSDSRFRKPIKPNTELFIEASCVKSRGMMVTYECSIKSEEGLHSEATIWATHNLK